MVLGEEPEVIELEDKKPKEGKDEDSEEERKPQKALILLSFRVPQPHEHGVFNVDESVENEVPEACVAELSIDEVEETGEGEEEVSGDRVPAATCSIALGPPRQHEHEQAQAAVHEDHGRQEVGSELGGKEAHGEDAEAVHDEAEEQQHGKAANCRAAGAGPLLSVEKMATGRVEVCQGSGQPEQGEEDADEEEHDCGGES